MTAAFRTRQSSSRSAGSNAARRLDRLGRGHFPHRRLADAGVGTAQRLGQRALGVEPRGHVLDRRHHAGDARLFPQRAKRHPLLHAVEVRRGDGRRAGHQVVVKGGREDLHLAGGEHVLEPRQQAALGELGHDLGQGPAARRGGGDSGDAPQSSRPRCG